MTKEQFIEIVQGVLTSGDANPDLIEKYHTGRINLIASMAFSAAIYQVFYRQLDEKDLYARDYVAEVKYDEEFDEYYSDLPIVVIQLPRNSGVHKISPLREPMSFVPINSLAEDVFSQLEVGQTISDPSYYLRSKKVVYQYYDWKQKLVKKVRMRLVPPLEDYADDDEITIPAGKEDMILQFTTQILSGQLPTDNTPNQDDKQIQ